MSTSLAHLITTKPWNADSSIPRNVDFPKGMLGSEERRAFYWMGRECVDGRGHIVDAGAFLGASAYCFAAGLADNPRPSSRRTRIHSYDMFSAFEQYTADQVSRDFGGHDGQSFRDMFDYQVAAHVHRIVAHEGDITQQRWTGEPIEILFIDVAKSNALNGHICDQFFGSLISGHSLVVHQDHFLSRHPCIHVSMEYMAEHFEVVDPAIKWCSRAYRCLSPVPRAMLDRVRDYGFTLAEERALLDRAQAKEADACHGLFDLLQVCVSLYGRDPADARVRLSRFSASGDADLVRILEGEREFLAGLAGV
jgi:hypothetical protein